MPGESQQTPTGKPDPSVLTTEQLLREVENAERRMEARLAGIEGVVHEKFRGVKEHLELIERQRVEQKVDTKAAVDAALIAQKEAVKEQTTASERAIAKSETATTKSIEQLGDTFTTAFDGMRRDIDDLKGSQRGSEGAVKGGREAHAAGQQWQIWIAGAAVTVVIALVIIVANIITGA